MKKSIFFFVLLFASSVLAQDNSLFLGVTEEETKLLNELSLRRQELDRREDSLKVWQNELSQKEKKQQKINDTFVYSLPRDIQLYMNMKPSKAASLLDKKSIFEAKNILNQMPAVYAARILNQMDEAKASLIIDKNTNTRE